MSKTYVVKCGNLDSRAGSGADNARAKTASCKQLLPWLARAKCGPRTLALQRSVNGSE